METFESESLEVQYDEVIYQLPTVNEMLDATKMLYCMSEFVTYQHFPRKLTWVVTSWGEFLSLEFDRNRPFLRIV